MSDELHQQKQTPKDALLDALAACEVGDEFKEVLILFNTKSGKSGSYDSGLTSAESGWLAVLFIVWVANANTGTVMGLLKKQLFEHVGFEEHREEEDPNTPSAGDTGSV